MQLRYPPLEIDHDDSMTNSDTLRKLESSLWEAADQLRANLNGPVRGIIPKDFENNAAILEISRLGRQLHDRLRVMGSLVDDVRAGVERAVGDDNRSVASLESRVLVSARRFEDLGEAVTEEIGSPSSVETAPRRLSAPELISQTDLLNEPEPGGPDGLPDTELASGDGEA